MREFFYRHINAVWVHIPPKMPPIGSILAVMEMEFRRIEDLRVDHDLTQRQVAEYLHMHLQVYRRYEKGMREIPVWAVIQLSQLYQCSTDCILGLSDKK